MGHTKYCTTVTTPMCRLNKLYVRSSTYGASTVTHRCDPQARPSTSFVENTIDLPWQNFVVQSLEVPGSPYARFIIIIIIIIFLYPR